MTAARELLLSLKWLGVNGLVCAGVPLLIIYLTSPSLGLAECRLEGKVIACKGEDTTRSPEPSDVGPVSDASTTALRKSLFEDLDSYRFSQERKFGIRYPLDSVELICTDETHSLKECKDAVNEARENIRREAKLSLRTENPNRSDSNASRDNKEAGDDSQTTVNIISTGDRILLPSTSEPASEAPPDSPTLVLPTTPKPNPQLNKRPSAQDPEEQGEKSKHRSPWAKR